MTQQLCPVCSMDATGSDITTEHIGIVYHFCSEQCLENFTARPSLYVGKGAQKSEGKILIKRRTFTLDRPLTDADAESLKAVLQRMMGVRDVDISGAKVSVMYDLLEATAAQVGREIEQAGADLGQGWAERLKRSWVQYTEETELGNLAVGDAPCCNRPPHA